MISIQHSKPKCAGAHMAVVETIGPDGGGDGDVGAGATQPRRKKRRWADDIRESWKTKTDDDAAIVCEREREVAESQDRCPKCLFQHAEESADTEKVRPRIPNGGHQCSRTRCRNGKKRTRCLMFENEIRENSNVRSRILDRLGQPAE